MKEMPDFFQVEEDLPVQVPNTIGESRFYYQTPKERKIEAYTNPEKRICTSFKLGHIGYTGDLGIDGKTEGVFYVYHHKVFPKVIEALENAGYHDGTGK